MRNRRRWAASVSLGAVLVLVVAGCATDATSGQPEQSKQTTSEGEYTEEELRQLEDGLPVDNETQQSQALINAAVRDLAGFQIANEVEAGEQQPDGFGSVTVDIPTRTLTIRWKGEPPAVIDEVKARHPEITIDVMQTQFTDRELEREAMKIIRKLEDALDGRGKPNPISLRGDASLVVDVQTFDDSLTVEEVGRAIATITQAPVRVTLNAENPMEFSIGTRQTDVSPYCGGAGIRVPAVSNGYCTSGFAVKKRANAKKFMTTAFHCIYNASQSSGSTGSVNSESGQGMGTWSRTGARVERDKDTALIEIPSNRDIKPRAYWGGPYSSADYKIDGYMTNSIGDLICSGGANAGAKCNLTVFEKKIGLPGIDGTILTNMWSAQAPANTIAIAQGDSGGPMYQQEPNGKRYARGAIVGVRRDSNPSVYQCQNYTIHWGKGIVKCDSVVHFVGIQPMLNELSIDLL